MPNKGDLYKWESVDSGIDLINWSALARGDRSELEAEIDVDIFNERWTGLDTKYGRWLCWVAFAVGAECIARGAFEIHECRPIEVELRCSLTLGQIGSTRKSDRLRR
jgi:hypothetical protein